MQIDLLRFPDKFMWGAGTSAHQVEGGNINDWSEWELKNCSKLASESQANYYSKTKFKVPDTVWEKIRALSINPYNYISGAACDHYNCFLHDFDLAKELNHNAHRFSIEWSRIEPEEGKFNQLAVEHYREVVIRLKEREIEPFVTLWHFTNPLWVRDQGGWKGKNTVKYFARYVKKIVESLKSQVTHWITINEPLVYANSSYLRGTFPAQKKNPVSFILAINNLIKAHILAYKIIKEASPKARVGIAKNIIYFKSYKHMALNILFIKLSDWLWNNYFLRQINLYQDFIGVNHYFHYRINFCFNKNDNKMRSDLGWELYPEAIYYALKDLHQYKKPIYITESGLADAEDTKRDWYIREVLKNVHRAIKENVDVRGYFYWSLMDNFEWNKGFWPRFGLIEVDHANMQRRVRKSAFKYAKIIQDNAISIPIP